LERAKHSDVWHVRSTDKQQAGPEQLFPVNITKMLKDVAQLTWMTQWGDDWVKQNWGWNDADARKQVASDCEICKACADSPTTTTAPETTIAPETTTAPDTTSETPMTTEPLPDRCPIDTPCQFAGSNATCGQRIDWLMSNRSMTRIEAGNLVAKECDVCKSCESGPNPTGFQQLNQRCGESPFGDCNPDLECKGKTLKLCVKPDNVDLSVLPRQFHESCSASAVCSSNGLKCQKMEGDYSECVIDPYYGNYSSRGLRGAVN